MIQLNNTSNRRPVVRNVLRMIAAALFAITLSTQAWGQSSLGSAFTYQGELKLTGEPVNDTADFEFTLWDELEEGTQIGSLIPVNDVSIVDGLFNVELDFGVMAFNGDARWLQIAVRSPAGVGEFTTLSPRQSLTAAPYAIQTRGLFVDDDGNVGIGTTAPQHMLNIGDDSEDMQSVMIRSRGGTGSWKGGAAFGGDSASVILGEFDGVATVAAHNAWLSSWAHLNLNPAGNVGIGIADPAYKLDVAGPLRSYAVDTGNVNAGGAVNAAGMMCTGNITSLGSITTGGSVDAFGDIYTMGDIEAKGEWGTARAGMYVDNDLEQGFVWGDTFRSSGVVEVWDAYWAQAGMYIDELGQGVVWGDWKFFRADNPFDPETEIWYGCLEGPEQAAYNRGTAQLFNGSAYIEFPDHFRAVAVAEGMSVQLTPKSAQSLGLAVVEADLDGVVVQELHNGSGNYEFYFTVTAARRGSERFDVVRPKGDRVTGPMPRDRRTNR